MKRRFDFFSCLIFTMMMSMPTVVKDAHGIQDIVAVAGWSLKTIECSSKYYGNSSAYLVIVSPVNTKSSPVPARIPLRICRDTMGSPFGNSASTLQVSLQVVLPVLTTTY